MLELLRDPVWQFVGAILAVIAIAVAFWIYWLQRQTKEIAFGIVSSRRLLSIGDEVSSRVSVQLDGKVVKDLHLLVYALKNSGNRAVSQSDFQRPLSISFVEGQVVAAEVVFQTPSNLGARLVVTESRVELEPLLLNSGDQVLVQILLSATSPHASVDARVVDVPALVPISVIPRLPPFFESGMPTLIVAFLLLALATYVAAKGEENTPPYLLSLGFAAFAVLYSLGSRLLERFGRAAKRYVSET